MATIPVGATPLENMVGSAPGVELDLEGTKVFCLQGVPGEMQRLFSDHVLPLIKNEVGHFFSREVNYMVKGVSEAMIAPALAKIVEANPKEAMYLKTHPQGYGADNVPQIRAQVITRGSSEADVNRRLEFVVSALREEIAKLGGKIVS
jgi:molybdopterin-biosynthesis enzyme MoeA-like protein